MPECLNSLFSSVLELCFVYVNFFNLLFPLFVCIFLYFVYVFEIQ